MHIVTIDVQLIGIQQCEGCLRRDAKEVKDKMWLKTEELNVLQFLYCQTCKLGNNLLGCYKAGW